MGGAWPSLSSRCSMSAELSEGERCDKSNREGRRKRERCERGLQAVSAQVRRVKFITRLDGH